MPTDRRASRDGAIPALVVCLATLWLSGPAQAHHSFIEFDQSVTEEYEGEIVAILWRNPHIRMSILTRAADGSTATWDMEAQDLNTLGRLGVSSDLFEVGQRVRFAGWPSRRREHYMALTHLLLDDSTEVVMRMRTKPRWSNDALGGGDLHATAADSRQSAKGLFRVWSFARTNRPSFTDNPPLTESARAAYEAFDPVTDDPVIRCEQPGMPEAMTFIGPHPVEFVDEGDRVLLRVESDDVVRIIHTSAAADDGGVEPSPLGYSVGRWENDRTFIVTTTRVSWPYTKINGLVAVPQSENSVFVERFTLSDDQDELAYSFSMTDPANFTATVNASDYTVWRWLPGAKVEPYECTLD